MQDDALELALQGYQRVIEDESLDDYPYGEVGHQQLSAYALYRSMLAWLRLGDLEQAAQAWTFLQEAYSVGSTGQGYSQLADEVWQSFQAAPDLARACQIAQAFASANPEDVLQPLAYGYANKVYTASDLCPYTTP